MDTHWNPQMPEQPHTSRAKFAPDQSKILIFKKVVFTDELTTDACADTVALLC